MKKFLLFALCAVVSVSVFAKPYQTAQFKELKTVLEKEKYAVQADVSEQSNYNHMDFALRSLNRGKKLTVEQINENAKRFKNLSCYNVVVANHYANNGHEKEALQASSKNKTNVYMRLHNYFCKKDKVKAWQYGYKTVINGGIGYTHENVAKTVHQMFRYKPESITKEQQIEFLKKIAQIYPIPGTDFSKYKALMGFVGFKYKQLTGKELF